MKTTTFLGTAETRADHLRELSQHLRALDITSASLREVEHEIPELELAMAVYRRLNAEGADTSDLGDPQAFLAIAENRADHLRQISHQMHSLEWVHASLTEVENEIPELELTIKVYRRLTGDADATAQSPAKAASTPPKTRPANTRPAREDETAAEAEPVAAPSFSQFALQHLDASGGDSEANGAR